MHVRWFLWVISVILELIWELSAHIYDILKLDRYSSRQELINHISIIKQEYEKSEYIQYLLINIMLNVHKINILRLN